MEGCGSKNKTEDPIENMQNFGQTHYQEVTRKVGNVLSLQGNAEEECSKLPVLPGHPGVAKAEKIDSIKC